MSVPCSVPEVLARLDGWLMLHRPRYQRSLLPGATASELDALGKELGRPLPADLRTLLAWHNGQGGDVAGALVDSWQLMCVQRIAAAQMDLQNTRQQTGWRPGWVPFLEDDQGDYLCLDASQPLPPVRGVWLGKAEQPIVAPSLAAWLEAFVTTAEHGEYVEDPERGDFLRRTSS